MTATEEKSPIHWVRTALLGFAILFPMLVAQEVVKNLIAARPIDFVSFWAAGRLAATGHAADAYNLQLHHAVEDSVAKIRGLLPFPYPPPFLMFVAPFGALPFAIGFGLWTAVTATFCVFATRADATPRHVLSHPAFLVTGLTGQNGYLTTGLFALGMTLLKRRPWLAGATLGMLVIKPQLGLLLPVALVAARAWKAIAGAALSATALLITAFLIFGAEVFEGFFALLPSYGRWMSESRWPWGMFASPFAFVRYFGAAEPIAYGVHAACALAAAAVAFRAWARDWDSRVPVLAAATLLVPPYLLTYDSLLLAIPFGWLMTRGAWRPALLIWVLCLLPLASYSGFYTGPNPVPFAAGIALWALARREAKLAPPRNLL